MASSSGTVPRRQAPIPERDCADNERSFPAIPLGIALLALGALAAMAQETAPAHRLRRATSPSKTSRRSSLPGGRRFRGTASSSPMCWTSRSTSYRSRAARPAPSPLRARAPGIPYWSKDGKSLYFLSDRSDSSQLWQLPLASFGEARQVTNLSQGVDSLRFSPDESRLLLDFTDSDAKVTEPGDEEEAEGQGRRQDEARKRRSPSSSRASSSRKTRAKAT